MKALARSLLSLLFLLGLLIGSAAAVLHPISGQRHLAIVRVAAHTTPPTPDTPDTTDASPADSQTTPPALLNVQHQSIAVIDGQLLLGRYLADHEDMVTRHEPGKGLAGNTTLSPGLHMRTGPAAQRFYPDPWLTRGNRNVFALRLPLLWIAIAGLSIAIVGYGSRGLYHLFTTQRIPSAMCLHCNKHYEDPDAKTCPHCNAPRPSVTVTKSGRPI